MTALTKIEIQQKLNVLGDNWLIKEGKLTCEYNFASFLQAVEFVYKLRGLFEEMAHHPDILIQYNKVCFSLSTHDAGGKLTNLDFEVARKIQEEYSLEMQ